jgi:hypothetical protein
MPHQTCSNLRLMSYDPGLSRCAIGEAGNLGRAGAGNAHLNARRAIGQIQYVIGRAFMRMRLGHRTLTPASQKGFKARLFFRDLLKRPVEILF